MKTADSVLPVFAIERHRLTTDGVGVTTLVGAYGCPLKCRYCLNPHAWNPTTLSKCTQMPPQDLYEKVKIDALYFLATGGGVTFGGGESLLHTDFICDFREICGPEWNLTAETSLNVPTKQLLKVLDALDDFIVDIKDLNPVTYEAYTGMSSDLMLSNLTLLKEQISPDRIHVRVPLIPNFNTQRDLEFSVQKLQKMGFTRIEVFPYAIKK